MTTVLIADENAVSRKLLKAALKTRGFKIDVAQDGWEVVDLAERTRYDALVVDMDMTSTNGFALAEHIRDTPYIHTPKLLATSADGSLADRAEYVHNGFDDFFPKPIDLDRMTAVISGANGVAAPAAAAPPPPEAAANVQKPASVSVLIADDSSVSRKLFRVALKARGFEVDVAADGWEVIEMMERRAYDALVIDINMPNGNGYQVAEYIREHPQLHTPMLLAMSGDGSLAQRQHYIRRGFDDFFPKPMDMDRLASVLTGDAG